MSRTTNGDSYWTAAGARRLTRRGLLRGAAAVGVSAGGLSLIGCSSSNNSTANSKSTASGTKAATASASTARAGVTGTAAAKPSAARVRIGLQVEPVTVDPHDSTSSGVDDIYLRNLYNGLYVWGTDGKLVPQLADSYEIPSDGSQITFKLKKGVTFQNGDPLTAEDVAYSLQRVLNPSMKRSKVPFASVDSVQAVDDSTVVYKMKKPDAGFVADGFGILLVVPKKYVESVGKDGFLAKPIGSGAYRLRTLTKGTGASFDRFDQYFASPAGFAGADYKLIPEDSSRVNALDVGDIDIAESVAPELAQRMRSIKGAQVVALPNNIDCIYSYALTSFPGQQPNDFMKAIQDKRVRQAINYAVDRAGIAKAIYGAEFAEPFSVTNPSQSFHIGKVYDFDPKKAKQLLDAAGVSNLTVNMYQPSGTIVDSDKLGAAVASNLKDVGITGNLQIVEFSVFITRLRADVPPYNDGMIFAWATTAAYSSPFVGTDNKWTCGSLYGQYCSSDFDGLMAKARATFDDQQRNAIVKQAFDLLYDDAPGLWTVLLKTPYGLRSSVVRQWTPRVGNNSILYLEDLVPA